MINLSTYVELVFADKYIKRNNRWISVDLLSFFGGFSSLDLISALRAIQGDNPPGFSDAKKLMLL